MIALENATVRFGARTVLNRLSIAIPIGQSLAILGPNGRGKTTALKSMLGFQHLDEGRRIAPKIVGYVPQSASMNQRYCVRDVVVMGRAAHLGLFGQPGPEDVEAASLALDRVGIAGFAEAMFDRLSGGERQLVLLARALATGSDVIVLDEPAAALDLRNQERLLTLLAALRDERNRAIAFTTHDPNQAFAADLALLMMPEAETLCGSVEEVLTAENLERLYGVAMRHTTIKGPDGRLRDAILPAFAGKEAA